MATGPLTLDQLRALIERLYQAKLDALSAMQSVSRTGISYSRVAYGSICDDLNNALAMWGRMTNGATFVFDNSQGGISTPEQQFTDADAV